MAFETYAVDAASCASQRANHSEKGAVPLTVPKAVFLDVGWTLTYPHESMWDGFAAICKEAGSQLNSEEIERQMHRLLMDRRSQAIKELESGVEYPDSDSDFLTAFLLMSRLVFQTAGLDGSHETLGRRFLERFWNRANWDVSSDVYPSLDRLRARGIQVGIISNASSELLEFLRGIGLFPHFHFACVSAIEGFKKPDPRIYLRALKHAGVAPYEAVHVGDMFLEDVLGPQKVGIRSFLIDRGSRRMFPHFPETWDGDIQPRVHVVHGLDEVLESIMVA